MEVDEIQTPRKYTRVNSHGGGDQGGSHGGGGGAGAIGPTTTTTMTNSLIGNGVGGEMVVGNSNRFGRQWQHSSRIIRVSRASGGKDRHSKVWTAKGPRDRRVRLSVTTAIQFYDLQDRLGFDQPSKAVEWLIKAAADAINELPSLDTASFPREVSDEPMVGTKVVEPGGGEIDGDTNMGQQMGSKSGCSSNNSDTSKGSGGLSLISQKESRNKARERARVRTAKDKEKDGEASRVVSVSSIGQTSSFTQLLTAGISNLNETTTTATTTTTTTTTTPSPHHASGGGNQWLSSTSMGDYLIGTGFMGLSTSRTGQMQVGNNPSSLPQVMTLSSFGGHEQMQQQPQYPFMSNQHQHQHQDEQLIATGSGSNYNLNFTMSSTPSPSLNAGFNNRGTLQSNSPALLPYLQRFSADGSGLPFFLGTASTVDQHFQPPGLQLCYGDGHGPRQSQPKPKPNKN